MNVFNENEQNAMIDALKYTSDVVSALTLKINNQDDEINLLKNKMQIMEEEMLKISQKLTMINIKKTYSNVKLNTEDSSTEPVTNITNKKKEKNPELNGSTNYDNSSDSEKSVESENLDTTTNAQGENKSKNFSITSIGETEINNLRKIKAGQILDNLIKKKNEINELIEHKREAPNDDPDNENKSDHDKNEKKIDENIVTRRRNKIMRRF
jgi:hypothetical protein